MTKPKIYSRYDTPEDPGVTFTLPSDTQQQFKDECDINNIVKNAIRTGNTTLLTQDQRAEYFDSSAFTDYQASVQYVRYVDDDFNSLPSHVREKFAHDPSRYMAFMSEPANIPTAIDMGLIKAPEGWVDHRQKAGAKPNAKEQPAAATGEAGNAQSAT